MKILLLGSAGQVGRHLVQVLSSRHELIPLTRADLDLADEVAIKDSLNLNPSGLVINAAAYTAVDRAEDEPELAGKVNSMAPRVIAEHCARTNIPLIHYSTDYVFNGEGRHPYVEDDETNPLGVYGATKLEGERAVLATGAENLVLRTSWVYSWQGSNFYNTMLRLAVERNELNIVADQVGSPTYAGSIAVATSELVDQIANRGGIGQNKSGIYHLSCQGETNWCDFARALLALNGYADVAINGITTDEYPTQARRPAYSVLDNTRLEQVFGVILPQWADSLRQCVNEGRAG